MKKQDPVHRQSKPKKKYKKPSVRSEEIMTFGALCNGTMSGQRKASTGAPDFCNNMKLLS